MGRRKGEAHPPGVAGKDGKISRGLKRHYAANPRSEQHNAKIAEGRRRWWQRKRSAD